MSTNDTYEKVCISCRRTESLAGRMFNMYGDMYVCGDCLQKTLDMMKLSDRQISDIVAKSLTTQTPDAGHPEENRQRTTPDTKPEEGTSNTSQPPHMPGVYMSFPFMGMDMFQGIPASQRIKSKPKTDENKEIPALDYKKLPPPHKIKEQLDEFVIGQDKAKKVISVAVYNHYKRVTKDAHDDIEIDKSNILMLGPTGSGKTYIVQTLARILNVPLAITDATSLTEAGYIGDDVESVLSKLLKNADNDVERAECGIVFIDEVDKIAKKVNAKSRDVSGESVQQGLLKILEGARIDVPVGASSKNALVPMVTMDTKNILFICGGAFEGIERKIAQRMNTQVVGFEAQQQTARVDKNNLMQYIAPQDLKAYGLIPEIIGRLPVLTYLNPLDSQALRNILTEPKNALTKQYKKLMAMDGVSLSFEDAALDYIVEKAQEYKLGARGLRGLMETIMTDLMFELPSHKQVGHQQSFIVTKQYAQEKLEKSDLYRLQKAV